MVTNSLESNYRHICPATLPRRQSAKQPNFDHAVGEKQLFLNGSFLLILPPCPCLAPLSSHVRTLSRSPEKLWGLFTARSFPVLPPQSTGKSPFLSPSPTILPTERFQSTLPPGSSLLISAFVFPWWDPH